MYNNLFIEHVVDHQFYIYFINVYFWLRQLVTSLAPWMPRVHSQGSPCGIFG
jgi:hypothetical protein